ncbi:MAG TPA: aminopeptidase P family protein [Erysipelothrix sp.]|jgi:Xaa-Pro dipeptidase|nr:aminopeptidase P family protein [Erysipelothrix sp.]
MLNKVRNEMKNQQLDGLWITDPNSLNYLFEIDIETGERFIGVYITQTSVKLVLNKLFTTNKLDIIYYYDHQDIHSIIARLTSGTKIGLDKTMQAQYALNLINNHPEKEFVNGSDCVDKLRAIKTKEQINKMIKASKLNDTIMEIIRDELEVGMTEIQIRDRIEELFYEYGSEPCFTTIIAFGDHGTDPHAIPTNRILKENESIIIDMGCKVDDYCSDMTRTYFMNSNPIQEIYDLVLEANTKAIEAIKPGVTFSDIDKVARDIITKGGYGDYFTHRLGHGIGQEVHEPYDVSASNHQKVLPGMCFSIEPGIYKPKVDGVRIEDLVYINEQGTAEVLNHVPKNKPVLKK